MKLSNVSKWFPIKKGFGKKSYLKAVDDVSFNVFRGETFGLVGESGCGKTTLGRLMVRVYEPTSGKFLYKDRLVLFETERVSTFQKKDSDDLSRSVQLFEPKDDRSSDNHRRFN